MILLQGSSVRRAGLPPTAAPAVPGAGSLTVNQSFNPLASIADDLPETPVQVLLPQPNESPVQKRARQAINRETLLKQQGYTIVPDGEEKVLKVNRDWIAKGGDEGQWLLFVGGPGAAALKVHEVIFLDEINTEQEVVQIQTQRQEAYGCGTRTVTDTKELRSAYMISHGRVAYRA